MTYGNAADFREYHISRGKDLPVDWLDDELVDAALLVSSEWIDGIYGSQFSGYKTGGFEQEREWPRSSAWADNYPIHVFGTTDIPTRVVQATYEAAFRQLTTPGSLMVDYKPGKYKSVQIDGALSVEYNQFNSAYDIQVQIGAIDTLLWPLLTATGSKSSGLSGPVNRV